MSIAKSSFQFISSYFAVQMFYNFGSNRFTIGKSIERKGV